MCGEVHCHHTRRLVLPSDVLVFCLGHETNGISWAGDRGGCGSVGSRMRRLTWWSEKPAHQKPRLCWWSWLPPCSLANCSQGEYYGLQSPKGAAIARIWPRSNLNHRGHVLLECAGGREYVYWPSGGTKSLLGWEVVLLGLRRAGIMSHEGILSWQKCVGALDVFLREKDEFSTETVEFTLVKARDPFLWIWKKIDPMVNLEVTKQTVLAITDGGVEEASAPRMGAPS